MDNWVLKGVRNLVKETAGAQEITSTQVKVKVTHVLISNFDALVFNGDIEAHYPKTIGRFAVGIVTEAGADCYGVKKGDRVYLESALPCGECYSCKSGKPEDCNEIKIAGRDSDGFLRDFVVCEYGAVAPLPDSVDNMQALCIELIGIAENIYDKLNLSQGQRVAVVGGDTLGNIIAQVLQYHKVIPIVIDNNPSNLERARKCGVYYAFQADDDAVQNVAEATNGNMCDAAIYTTDCYLPVSLTARIVGNQKSIVFSGFSTIRNSIAVRDVLEKDLHVYGVTNAAGYTDSVINMLLHGAVNFDNFEKEILTQFDPVQILTDRCENILVSNKGKMTILKMIF